MTRAGKTSERRPLFCSLSLVCTLAACVNSGAPAPAGTAPDSGSPPADLDPASFLSQPPAPAPDDPSECTATLAHPDLDPQPVRPCTEERSNATTTFRYDLTGRLVYRAQHVRYDSGTYDEVYESTDVGNTRVETLTRNGAIAERHETRLRDGLPVEADHVTSDGDNGHSTWTHDAAGRQSSVVTDLRHEQIIERDLYDAAGRLYYADQSAHFYGVPQVWSHRFTLRSWYANGSLASEINACGGVPGSWPPYTYACGKTLKQWDACGNLTYSAYETAIWRYSNWVDWSWDPAGKPLTRHDRWNDSVRTFNATESYVLDGAGRVASSSSVKTNPPNSAGVPSTEEYQFSYAYDGNGRVIERKIDGQGDFHARFDEAGQLVELDRHDGAGLIRWTYEGCGR